MKILYDHQTFVYQRFGGISRYFTELAASLNKSQNTQARISTLLSDNTYLKTFDRHKSFSILKGRFPGRMTVYNSINRLITNQAIRAGQFDMFHPTYYDTYFLKALGNRPFVLTVHDMIHELYPGFWPNQQEVVDHKKELIAKASGVIAVSENTKKDILRLYPDTNPSKIRVVHLGNSFDHGYLSERYIKEDYLLFVGNREHYKNFKNFLQASQKVFTQYSDIQLICAGGGKFSSSELAHITELGLEKKVHYVPILNDAFLAGLYQYAELFVFPSLYEGFGIPILEAFASNCPVVLSNSSCFPEVASDASEYFDGNNIDNMAAVLISLIKDDRRKEELRKAGKKRLASFSWQNTALQTSDFYHEIFQNVRK